MRGVAIDPPTVPPGRAAASRLRFARTRAYEWVNWQLSTLSLKS